MSSPTTSLPAVFDGVVGALLMGLPVGTPVIQKKRKIFWNHNYLFLQTDILKRKSITPYFLNFTYVICDLLWQNREQFHGKYYQLFYFTSTWNQQYRQCMLNDNLDNNLFMCQVHATFKKWYMIHSICKVFFFIYLFTFFFILLLNWIQLLYR